MKTFEELLADLDAAQADLDAAQAALDAYEAVPDVGKYLVGHIDDIDIANRVLAVFKKAGIELFQETYEDLGDAQWSGALRRGGSWNNASLAGLFYALLDGTPTYPSASIGFRCVARPDTAIELISAETFLRRFEDERV